tara:strand:- start:351 stop:1988 length:1638 start_codon:yes stop_codon:yes gene_type:complete
MPKIEGAALRRVIKLIPNWNTEPYDEVAWATFNLIRSHQDTVEFPDILVALDELLGTATDLSMLLRSVTGLAKSARAMKRVHVSSSLVRPCLINSELPERGLSLLAKLGDEKCIRFYVETGSNKGHQSATVTLARKLIYWMRSSYRRCNINQDLVFEFVCNDSDALEKTRSIVGSALLEGVKVKLCSWPSWGSLSQVRYTFSGAIDAPVKTYEKLKSEVLIALQPFGWAGGTEMVICQGFESVVLNSGSSMLAPPENLNIKIPFAFRRLPFTERAESLPKDQNVASSLPDVLVTSFLKASLESVISSNPFSICPLYGMGKGQPMESYGAIVWSNVSQALLHLYEKSGVCSLLLNLSLDMGSAPVTVWPQVERDLTNKKIKIFKEPITSNEGVKLVLKAMCDYPVVICTVTGNKSQWVMDSIYRKSQLPPIFEGQGSLTQVLSMGRPFIKLSMRAFVDPSWPSDYLPVPALDEIDIRLQNIANSLVDDKGDSGLRAERLGTLFHEMIKSQSEIRNYFEICRQMVTSPSYDRLLWAAEALERLRQRA